MVDCETWGTNNEAVIISIGAVLFDPYAQHTVGESFHVAIDPSSCTFYGLKPDMTTIMWWMGEERDEARKTHMEQEQIDLASALDGFISWFGEDKPVWGYGAVFDNVILRSAFRLVGLKCPWSFRNDRCFRTFTYLAPLVPRPTNGGVVHHALDDAKSQAYWLQAIRLALGCSV